MRLSERGKGFLLLALWHISALACWALIATIYSMVAVVGGEVVSVALEPLDIVALVSVLLLMGLTHGMAVYYDVLLLRGKIDLSYIGKRWS